MESYNFPAQRDRDLCSSRGEGLKVLTRVIRRGLLGELAYAQTLGGSGTVTSIEGKENGKIHSVQKHGGNPGTVSGAVKAMATTTGWSWAVKGLEHSSKELSFTCRPVVCITSGSTPGILNENLRVGGLMHAEG